jgi:hypothetical protein
VSSWSASAIVVRLPSQAPFEGPYTVSVRVGTRDCVSPTIDIPSLPTLLRKVTLDRLYCRKQEDVFGSDACYFRISGLPGGRTERVPAQGEFHLDEGDTRVIGWSTTSVASDASDIRVDLWEADVDPDDHLGTYVIEADFPPRPLGLFQEARFTDDDAYYILYFRIDAVRP